MQVQKNRKQNRATPPIKKYKYIHVNVENMTCLLVFKFIYMLQNWGTFNNQYLKNDTW